MFGVFQPYFPVGLPGNVRNGSRVRGNDPEELMDPVGWEDDPTK